VDFLLIEHFVDLKRWHTIIVVFKRLIQMPAGVASRFALNTALKILGSINGRAVFDQFSDC